MHRMTLLALTALTTMVAGLDPSISNGTCYFGPNQQAVDDYIPCGNAADGTQQCCQARDICLSSNACFNSTLSITYLAGCTDESYGDTACPSKGDFQDQQWVGLVRCFVSDDDNEQWAPCEEPIQPTLNAGNTKCRCDTDSSTAVFTAAATLTPFASLPVKVGNDIAFFPGFTPTNSDTTTTGSSDSSVASATRTTSMSTTVSKTSSQQISTTTSSTAMPTSSAIASSSISTAAKAGIGVGIVGGVLALSGILFWLLWYRRRSQRKQNTPVEDHVRPQSEHGQYMSGVPPDEGKPADTEHPTRWEGKSELPTEANEIGTFRPSLSITATTGISPNTPSATYQPYHAFTTTAPSEVEGSPAASSSGLVSRSSGYEKPAYQSQIYEMPG